MSLRRIPRGLERPVPILFLDPVEAVVALVFLGIGIVAKQLIFGIGGMVGVVYLSRALSKGAKRGASKHALWMMGLDGVDPALKDFAPKPTQVDFTE